MGFLFEEIRPSDTKTFGELYDIYKILFPLPDEREPPGAFAEIAALNDNNEAQARFGRWHEVVAAIRLSPGGPVVGGHVFGATTSPAHIAFGCRASVQGIYTFLHPSARGRLSFLREARDYAISRALEAFKFDAQDGVPPPLIFLEVNNPLAMSDDEIAQDTKSSGIDPYQRYNVYKRRNFRPLALTYVQPALGPGSKPVKYLDLFCAADKANEIPADLIAAHLRAFISISVLKGRDAMSDTDFIQMHKALAARTSVPFVSDEHPDQRKIRDAVR